MTVKRNRQRGKQHQKRIATNFNGLNLGTLGGVDVLTEKFAIECKSRQKFVAEGWFEQAKAYAQGKTPLVIVHIKGKQYDKDFVILSLKDFTELVK